MRPGRTTAKAARGLPLECWFWALVTLALAVLLLAARIDATVTPATNAFIVFNENRLERFAGESADYRIVMLGDSRLKYATLSEEEMAGLGTASGRKVGFLRLVQNRAQFSDFEPFLPRLLEIAPDLVVLQSSLVTRERSRQINLRILQRFIVWNLVDGEGPFNAEGLNQGDLQFGVPCDDGGTWHQSGDLTDAQHAALVAEVKSRGTHDSNGRNAQAVQAFIADAASRGIAVVALEVPVTERYRDLVSDPELSLAEPAAVLEASGATQWSYPGEFADDSFCDLIHLDADARAAFSEWLGEAAFQLLSGQHAIAALSTETGRKD